MVTTDDEKTMFFENCSTSMLVDSLKNHLFVGKFEMLSLERKKNIIKCVKKYNLTGSKINSIGRKQFAKIMVAACKCDKQMTGKSLSILLSLKKFNFYLTN